MTTSTDDTAATRLREQIEHAGRHLSTPFLNEAAFGDEFGHAVAQYRAAVAEEIAKAIEEDAAAEYPDESAYRQALADAVIARRIGAAI